MSWCKCAELCSSTVFHQRIFDNLTTKLVTCAECNNPIKDSNKICTKCKVLKPLWSFNKDKSRKDGYYNRCRECTKAEGKTEASRARVRRYHKKLTKKERLRRRLKYMYKMSLDDYDKLFKGQNGVCAICKLPEVNQRLCVDHDHKTGDVRGLLCDNCNKGLGHFFDNIDNLNIAVSYLQKRSCE